MENWVQNALEIRQLCVLISRVGFILGSIAEIHLTWPSQEAMSTYASVLDPLVGPASECSP